MPDKLNQFFEDLNGRNSNNNKIKENPSGIKRTSGDSGRSPSSISPGVKPGFTPNEFYNNPNNSEDGDKSKWEGNLIDPTGIPVETDGKFDLDNGWTEEKGPLPTRNFYEIFNDKSTDFFKHGLHIDGRTPFKVSKDALHTTDGSDASQQNPFRLDSFVESPYENTDPVMFGFEIVINAETSPLFNGGVEDFIQQFGFLKEVGSRSNIISNFKQQFFKFFKSHTPITSTGSDIPADRFYLSYYLKKVGGLENLVESNTSDKGKSFTDYKKDVIKLSFTEDVSLSIGSMAYLYKLLYWSKINGKNIIPQNLLRFDCDIIVTEIRNFKRVKKSINGGNGVQVLKDNLSRYVYSLYECQMFFDKMPHDSEISLGDTPKHFDNYELSFNYKFSSMRFEKWVPKYASDDTANSNGKPDSKYSGGGQYAYLTNDRMDPYEVKTNETTNSSVESGSISSTSKQPSPILLESFYVSDPTLTSGKDSQNPQVSLNANEGKEMSSMDRFKSSSKKAAKNLAKSVEKAAINQANSMINVRARILNNAIDKIRNSVGIGRMSSPKNVYVPGSTNMNSRFFYDVQNGLRDFLGESLGGALGK
jgi:hypothetical protein